MKKHHRTDRNEGWIEHLRSELTLRAREHSARRALLDDEALLFGSGGRSLDFSEGDPSYLSTSREERVDHEFLRHELGLAVPRRAQTVH